MNGFAKSHWPMKLHSPIAARRPKREKLRNETDSPFAALAALKRKQDDGAD